MFPIHVINLLRHKNRLEQFKIENSFLLDDTNFFPAYDGKLLPRRQLILDGLITEKNTYDPRALGILKSHVELWKIAAKSKHGITIMEDDIIIHKDLIKATEQIIRENKPFDLIAWSYNLDWPIRLETAQGLPKSLISYLVGVGNSERIELLNQFGSYGDKINKDLYLSQSITYKFIKANQFTGLSCYTVSPKGAKKLLARLPIDNYDIIFDGLMRFIWLETGIDVSMTHFYKDMDVFLCSPFLAYSNNLRGK